MRATEAAREIRKDLRKSFPDTPFKVRTRYYDDGSAIIVSWSGYPPKEDVREVIGKYEVIRRNPDGFVSGGGNRFIILKRRN